MFYSIPSVFFCFVCGFLQDTFIMVSWSCSWKATWNSPDYLKLVSLITSPWNSDLISINWFPVLLLIVTVVSSLTKWESVLSPYPYSCWLHWSAAVWIQPLATVGFQANKAFGRELTQRSQSCLSTLNYSNYAGLHNPYVGEFYPVPRPCKWTGSWSWSYWYNWIPWVHKNAYTRMLKETFISQCKYFLFRHYTN